MKQPPLFQLAVAALLLAGLGAEARAATDPPLAPALSVSALRGLRRLALAVAGAETPASIAARAEVEAALMDTDHDVTLLPAAQITLPPDRAMLDIAARYGAAALVLVQPAPAYGANAIWIGAYDLTGARLFAYGGRLRAPVVPLTPVAPPTAAVAVDLRLLASLDGPDFYRALGRPDLAHWYESRRDGKTALRVGGGILLAGGVLWGILDVFAAGVSNLFNPNCSPGSGSGCQSASGAPWVVALVGVGMLIAPAFYATDPLRPSERQALLDNAARAAPRPSLSFSLTPAPMPGGGALVAGGRF